MADPMPPAGFAHPALFYHSGQQYQAAVTGFVRAGLAAGEPVLVAVPAHHLSLLREALHGLNGRANLVSFADMTGLGRNPGRIIPAIRGFTDAHPGRRARFVGEPIWPGRSVAETREATRHEALINLAFGGAQVTILCPYDAASLPAAVLADARHTHPAVIEHGRRQPSPAYTGATLPTSCDQPLPAPPATAQALPFSAATGLAAARALAAACARRAGLDDDRAADLALAVGEVTANTLQHTPGAAGTLHAWHTPGRATCQIRDRGHITDPLAGRRRQDAATAGGHGLWLAHQLCDLAELRTGPGGTSMRLHIQQRLPAAASARRPGTPAGGHMWIPGPVTSGGRRWPDWRPRR
jgi:anti-sigma regulatory factor (Ser/Thr protein kinase)